MDHFSQYSKKWPFLATLGKIAISQVKEIVFLKMSWKFVVT
jgi:hypothetical protein